MISGRLQAACHGEPRKRAQDEWRDVQVENGALRAEVRTLRRQSRELAETLAMSEEDLPVRYQDTAAQLHKLRWQLDETRRARTVEMSALVIIYYDIIEYNICHYII